jgi:hypothetical protein
MRTVSDSRPFRSDAIIAVAVNTLPKAAVAVGVAWCRLLASSTRFVLLASQTLIDPDLSTALSMWSLSRM